MSKKEQIILSKLQREGRIMLQRRRELWLEYEELKAKQKEAYSKTQSAKQRRQKASIKLQTEYNAIIELSDKYSEIWDEYYRLRDDSYIKRTDLERQIQSERHQMDVCLQRARYEYEKGNAVVAEQYIKESELHKANIEQHQISIGQSIKEVIQARCSTYEQTPRIDSSRYHAAKNEFNEAKSSYENALWLLRQIRKETQYAHKKFLECHQRYFQIKERIADLESKKGENGKN